MTKNTRNIELQAKKIHYEVFKDTLRTQVSGFEIQGQQNERNEQSTTASVTFSAGMSGDEAISILRIIMDRIQEHGLPLCSFQATAAEARCLLRCQKDIDTLSARLETVSSPIARAFVIKAVADNAG